MRCLILTLLGLARVLPASRVEAQQMERHPTGPAMGASMDRFIYEGEGATAVSFRFSALRPGSIGTEVGISLFPQALAAGVLLLAPDLGPAYQVSLPGAVLLIKAGGSAIAGLGREGVLVVPGLHLGAGLLIQSDRKSGVRIDLIRHYYRYSNEIEQIWSIGLGFAIMPGGRT